MKLSVSMIVKNEESCLATCLRSVVGADELVVVDTGSTDRTREIAAEFGAKLFDFPWIDDFAAARNFSLSKCTGDFVLILDADEALEYGGIAKVRAAIERAGDFKTIGVKCISASDHMKTVWKINRQGILVGHSEQLQGPIPTEHGNVHWQPRIFKRCPYVFWKGAIHNYLSVVEDNPSDVVIRYGYSEAHKKDPDRSLRILMKVLEENPSAVRETYYLAREYWYRRDYESAVKWYTDYLKRAQWAPEMADGWLMLARCLWQLQRGDEARDCCLQAIKINADFREALLFMSEMSGPKNRECWKLYASMATDKEVLFVRDADARPAEYYDKIFAASRDMSRYDKLLQRAASWSPGRVLDVCCGTGELGKYVADYHGIDFSREAVAGNTRLSQGDVFKVDLSGYDTYALLETLEHVDDLALLRRLPAATNVVFSVPSFTDLAHLRTYNERIIRSRFGSIMRIQRMERFNWTGTEWDSEHAETDNYILLVRGRVYPF